MKTMNIDKDLRLAIELAARQAFEKVAREKYETNSENARQVRRLALKVYGGIESTKVIF